VACPYFVPIAPHPFELWPHRHSLPLGDGFSGQCGACSPAGECDDETLSSRCNLGYADCVHLPVERELDAWRFVVASESATVLRVQFCGERAHSPVLCGELRYDRSSASWIDLPDPRVASLAQAAIRAWIRRHVRAVSAGM
jgi:hypothetical protein